MSAKYLLLAHTLDNQSLGTVLESTLVMTNSSALPGSFRALAFKVPYPKNALSAGQTGTLSA